MFSGWGHWQSLGHGIFQRNDFMTPTYDDGGPSPPPPTSPSSWCCFVSCSSDEKLWKEKSLPETFVCLSHRPSAGSQDAPPRATSHILPKQRSLWHPTPHTHPHPSSGRRTAAILEEFIRCALKRIWLKCRLNLLWVRLEECHLFTKRRSNSFFIWYLWWDTQTPPPCLQLSFSTFVFTFYKCNFTLCSAFTVMEAKMHCTHFPTATKTQRNSGKTSPDFVGVEREWDLCGFVGSKKKFCFTISWG